jgi:dienelactone hydrolase
MRLSAASAAEISTSGGRKYPMVKIFRLIFPVAIIVAFVAAGSVRAEGPVDFGKRAVQEALAARGLKSAFEIKVMGTGQPESFEITFLKRKTEIRAADANGALYGALELAERIRRQGAQGLRGAAVAGRPFLRDRGWNLFLTLPWNYGANDTDYDPQALVDPARWWFANDDYWRTLFDLMAAARLNWVDIHGSWDISVTDAPNLYAYFVQSERFPKVGVSPEIKETNLRQLNKIIAMAHERGIRVSLMAYEARFDTPHAPNPYPENEQDNYDYTREVVEKMIRQAPALDAIGFRIGESGHGEEFFNCYLEAVKSSGRDIPLITRSWVARKAKIVPLAKASTDFTVEIKYNGEQWGAPYMLMGGRMAGWYSYSFEDYLSDSSTPDAARLWPGNPAPDGETWPSEPYKIVWQVRANGTHRILPFYNPRAVRRAIKSMPVGTASGFVVEGLETYYPKSPRYYVADPNDLFCDWTHQRDWMFLNMWGRLGYDPETPDTVFDAQVADKLGAAAAPLTAAWRAASRIVHTAFSAFSLGPDHRNHAIELEWGGDSGAFLTAGPFDSHVFKPIGDALAEELTGWRDGRIHPAETAASLAADAAEAARATDIALASAPEGEQKRLKELIAVCGQAAHLGRYYAERFLATLRYGQSDAGIAGAGGRASSHMAKAAKEWEALAANPFYKPFTEHLRMLTNTFHWSLELPKVQSEAVRLAGMAAPIEDPIPPLRSVPPSPLLSLEIKEGVVGLSFPAAGLDAAWALVKPLPSTTFFHKVPMELRGDRYVYEFPRDPWGHAVAAEIRIRDRLIRAPGYDADAPYLIVPSKNGPTPLIYSSEEALAFLDPSILTPEEHGLLVISSRARDFHRKFPVATQRKILEPVRRGMTLVVLAQDYTGDQYSPDWLPKALNIQWRWPGFFDPAGLFGMSRIDHEDIVRMVFLPSPGWEIAGNGAAAVLPWGEGRIAVMGARLIESRHIPGAAASLGALLASGSKDKPVVIIDAGTETGVYASAVLPDILNAIGIPFLTLGEVVARKQGVAATAPIPGTVDDDAILAARDIRPQAMINTFLENKTKAAAALPIPASREEFEIRRATLRRETLRSLGLDPLPPRTPLNARLTGVLHRQGYRIEKVAFDSRPNFPVTGYLYVPDGAEGKKLPVVVNPHGHWGWKKQEPTVQSRLIAQALNGYLAFVIDSPGWSFEGNNRIERRPQGDHNDFRYILGSQNATSIYVWDLMRGLDYLATRPEADMSRIGITGASGGGLATLWAFAAEPRFAAAAPVVYASSYEVNPNNGCLCNHVPGSLQAGDRADVLSVRAPAPILIIGAEEDGEFPAAGMRKSGEKLRALWSLFGRGDDAWIRMFQGGHDYSQPMRETVMGFFDKYLKGVGDGSPVPEPAVETDRPDGPEMYVLPESFAPTVTMLQIARQAFAKPGAAAKETFSDFVSLNGGLPNPVPPAIREVEPADGKRRLTFVSEDGLTLPAVVYPAEGTAKAVAFLVSDLGKAEAAEEFSIDRLRRAGILCVALDPRGLGETRGIDLRFTTYLGRSPAFGMGWDITRAIAAFAPEGLRIAVVGRGPAAGQAALIAALLEPKVGFVAGLGTLREFQDAFRDDISNVAIQPRANYAPPLSRLRKLIKARAVWGFLDEPGPKWLEAILGWASQ